MSLKQYGLFGEFQTSLGYRVVHISGKITNDTTLQELEVWIL